MIPGPVADHLATEGWEVLPETFQSVSGGCIHRALLGEDQGGRRLFLKLNEASRASLFEGERRGLELLDQAGAIRVPKPLAAGTAGETAYLLLEGLDLRNGGGPGGDERMGERLAALHGHRSPDGRFGAGGDNHIGATSQPNGWKKSWADFFAERRLGHMLDLANARGGEFSETESTDTLAAARAILEAHGPAPSLLHGDLWGGNAAFDENGEPVLFDPASYYGDAEADIAFTGMFGGFGPGFYRAYRERRPAPAWVELLHTIYNLYHLLNHFVLFGGGYGESARRSMGEIRGS